MINLISAMYLHHKIFHLPKNWDVIHRASGSVDKKLRAMSKKTQFCNLIATFLRLHLKLQ